MPGGSERDAQSGASDVSRGRIVFRHLRPLGIPPHVHELLVTLVEDFCLGAIRIEHRPRRIDIDLHVSCFARQVDLAETVRLCGPVALGRPLDDDKRGITLQVILVAGSLLRP